MISGPAGNLVPVVVGISVEQLASDIRKRARRGIHYELFVVHVNVVWRVWWSWTNNDEQKFSFLRTVVAELWPRDPRHVVEPAGVDPQRVDVGRVEVNHVSRRAQLFVDGVEEAVVIDAAEGEDLAVVVLLTPRLARQGALLTQARDYAVYPEIRGNPMRRSFQAVK